MYTRLQNLDPPRENASGTSPSLQQVGSCRIANIIIKLVTRIHELWSRHCGCTGSTVTALISENAVLAVLTNKFEKFVRSHCMTGLVTNVHEFTA